MRPAFPCATARTSTARTTLRTGCPVLGSNSTGWMNRLLTALPQGSPIQSRGAIQVGEAPLLLRGPAPVLGWSPTWFQHVDQAATDNIVSMLAASDPPLHDALVRGLKADALAEATGSSGDDNLSTFRKSFRGAGRLLAAEDGPRMAVLSVNNFDTHSQQGNAKSGYLFDALTELDTRAEGLPGRRRPRVEPDGDRDGDRVRPHRPRQRRQRNGPRRGHGGSARRRRRRRRAGADGLAGDRQEGPLRGQRPEADDRHPLHLQGRSPATTSACPTACSTRPSSPRAPTSGRWRGWSSPGGGHGGAAQRCGGAVPLAALRPPSAIARYRAVHGL